MVPLMCCCTQVTWLLTLESAQNQIQISTLSLLEVFDRQYRHLTWRTQFTMLLFCLTLNVGFTTESAEVDNTWSRQDNYILCTHIKMETIQQNYIWKCISTVSHDKSSRNKERCGVNASCMLYSFKIVFPTRQVFSTSALSVVKPTFNVRQNNSIVPCLLTRFLYSFSNSLKTAKIVNINIHIITSNQSITIINLVSYLTLEHYQIVILTLFVLLTKESFPVSLICISPLPRTDK